MKRYAKRQKYKTTFRRPWGYAAAYKCTCSCKSCPSDHATCPSVQTTCVERGHETRRDIDDDDDDDDANQTIWVALLGRNEV